MQARCTGPRPWQLALTFCLELSRSRRFAQYARDAEAVGLDLGCLLKHLLALEAGPRLVFAQDVTKREGMSGGGDVGNIERLDVPGVCQDARELGRVQLQLFSRQGEAGEAGDVGYLLFGDELGHPDIVLTPQPTAP